ncbi:selenoprotein S-like [Achroia grisella]|uniref:selenoprotein S-like n=1 Tax=Achroia grisella TaxID=688607 RepID=UPI0027D2AFF9|nr:selenoprotein S-like [Achroia grisella]XP_059055049.1 selenoprotein S-like [Achroia grisella]
MDTLIEEETESQWTMFNPITFVLQLLATYGWFMLGAAAAGLYLYQRFRPRLQKWQQAREDAEYHKDPDRVVARMEAIQRARDKQQQELLEASQRMLEQQKEREEQKRAEAAERLQKYGTAASAGHRLGDDADYLPLSGGASTSSYRPPKRSKCGGGGCGR